MKLFAYSIRDTVSETFSAPFYTPNDGVALRFVGQMIADVNNPLHKYPNDHFLYRVGEFSTESGCLKATDPTQICTVLSLVPKDDPRQMLIPGTEAVVNGPGKTPVLEAK